MVSLALIIFIMSILSAAFATASKTFSTLKAAGGLAEQLRGAMSMLRRDLAAPHFDPDTKKLSDIDFWTSNNGPPAGGFFRILQGASPTAGPLSGYGGSVIPTYISTRQLLHFTVVLPGLMPTDFFSTNVGNQASPLFLAPYSTTFNQSQRYQPQPVAGQALFNSQFAEVMWGLTPSRNPDGSLAMTVNEPNQSTSASGPQQLYTLRRRIRLLWPENNTTGGNAPTPAIPPVNPNGNGMNEISVPQTAGTFPVNRMAEATIPPFRLGMNVNAQPYSGTTLSQNAETTYAGILPGGAYPPFNSGTTPLDLVVDGVLSFDVRILLWDYGQADTDAVTSSQFGPPSGAPAALNGATNAVGFVSLDDPSVQAYSSNNLAYLASGTSQYGYVFDTWSQLKAGSYDYSGTNWQPATPATYATIPLFRKQLTTIGSTPNYGTIRIMAIQVTLRLYDFNSQTTRQVTMIQNL